MGPWSVDAVVARLRSGSRFEILVDPDLAQEWKRDPEGTEMEDVLAVEEIRADSVVATGRTRPTC